MLWGAVLVLLPLLLHSSVCSTCKLPHCEFPQGWLIFRSVHQILSFKACLLNCHNVEIKIHARIGSEVDIPEGLFNNISLVNLTVRVTNKTLPKTLFQHLNKLQSLDLKSNNLKDTDLPFSFGPNVSKVILDDNNLELKNNTALMLKRHTKLKELSLSSNRIKSLSELTASLPDTLKILRVNKNDIYMIDLKENLKVEELDLSYNRIDDLKSSKKLINIRRLKLSHNVIEEVNKFRRLVNLEELNLSYNEIHEVGSNVFTQLKKLRILHLAGNNIKTIGHSAFQTNSLQLLDLSSNNLSDIRPASFNPNNLPNLTELRLSNNTFSCSCNSVEFKEELQIWRKRGRNLTEPNCKGKASLLQIKTEEIYSLPCNVCPTGCRCSKKTPVKDYAVDCSKAQETFKLYTQLPKTLPHRTIELNMDNNNLTNLDEITSLNIYQHIRNLSVNNNNLLHLFRSTRISKSRMGLKLAAFSAENNRIKQVTIADLNLLVNCDRISLAHNRITTIGDRSSTLYKLKFLDLRNNSLKSISDDLLYNIPHIQELRAQNNFIEKIGNEALLSRTTLVRLYLSNNRISNISSFVLSEKPFRRALPYTLEKLHIDNNRLRDFLKLCFLLEKSKLIALTEVKLGGASNVYHLNGDCQALYVIQKCFENFDNKIVDKTDIIFEKSNMMSAILSGSKSLCTTELVSNFVVVVVFLLFCLVLLYFLKGNEFCMINAEKMTSIITCNQQIDKRQSIVIHSEDRYYDTLYQDLLQSLQKSDYSNVIHFMEFDIAGNDRLRNIEDALEQTQTLIVFLSYSYLDEGYNNYMLLQGIHLSMRNQIKLIILLTDDTKWKDIAPNMRGIRLDLFNHFVLTAKSSRYLDWIKLYLKLPQPSLHPKLRRPLEEMLEETRQELETRQRLEIQDIQSMHSSESTQDMFSESTESIQSSLESIQSASSVESIQPTEDINSIESFKRQTDDSDLEERISSTESTQHEYFHAPQQLYPPYDASFDPYIPSAVISSRL